MSITDIANIAIFPLGRKGNRAMFWQVRPINGNELRKMAACSHFRRKVR